MRKNLFIVACMFLLASCGGNSSNKNNNDNRSQEETTTQNSNATSDGWQNEGTVHLIQRNGNTLGDYPIQSKNERMRVYMDYQHCDEEYLKVRPNPDYNPYSSGQPLRCQYMAGPYYIKSFNDGSKGIKY